MKKPRMEERQNPKVKIQNYISKGKSDPSNGLRFELYFLLLNFAF